MRRSIGSKLLGPHLPMCWLCNGPLAKYGGIFALVQLPNGCQVKVHKACKQDTEELVMEDTHCFPEMIHNRWREATS
jgi:hypothetical protein